MNWYTTTNYSNRERNTLTKYLICLIGFIYVGASTATTTAAAAAATAAATTTDTTTTTSTTTITITITTFRINALLIPITFD